MSRRDSNLRAEFGLPLSKDQGGVAVPPVVDAGEQVVRFTMSGPIAVPAPSIANYSPQPGDELKFVITMGGAGGYALTWNAIYRGMPATGGAATAGQILACKAMWTGAKWTFLGGDATFG